MMQHLKSITGCMMILVYLCSISGCVSTTPMQNNTHALSSSKEPVTSGALTTSQVAYFMGGTGMGAALGAAIGIFALGALI